MLRDTLELTIIVAFIGMVMYVSIGITIGVPA